MIDAIEPEHLVASIKRAPSLRGMILGYIAEQMFEIHVPDRYNLILAEHIAHHDDHDRTANKSDRTITFAGRTYGVQLKSIQTNSITRNLTSGLIEACVQNDASDRRDVVLEDGRTITTTCYLRGEYDILAVPLFPFTGKWDFAYKLNSNCAASTSRKYDAYTQPTCYRRSNASPGPYRPIGTPICSTCSRPKTARPSAHPISSRSQGEKFE